MFSHTRDIILAAEQAVSTGEADEGLRHMPRTHHKVRPRSFRFLPPWRGLSGSIVAVGVNLWALLFISRHWNARTNAAVGIQGTPKLGIDTQRMPQEG